MKNISGWWWAIGAALSANVAAQSSVLPIDVTNNANAALHVIGVAAHAEGDGVVVAGRISRDRRAQILSNKSLALELRAADGSVKASESMPVSAHQLPRRSARDLPFRLRLPQTPASGETLHLVLGQPKI